MRGKAVSFRSQSYGTCAHTHIYMEATVDVCVCPKTYICKADNRKTRKLGSKEKDDHTVRNEREEGLRKGWHAQHHSKMKEKNLRMMTASESRRSRAKLEKLSAHEKTGTNKKKKRARGLVLNTVRKKKKKSSFLTHLRNGQTRVGVSFE